MRGADDVADAAENVRHCQRMMMMMWQWARSCGAVWGCFQLQKRAEGKSKQMRQQQRLHGAGVLQGRRRSCVEQWGAVRRGMTLLGWRYLQ